MTEEFENFDHITERMRDKPSKPYAYDRRSTGTAKMVEMVLVGVVTAAIIHFFSLPRFEEKIENEQRELVKLRQDFDQLRRDLYVPRGSGTSATLEPFESIADTK